MVTLVVSLAILIWVVAVGRTVLAASMAARQRGPVSSSWGLNQILGGIVLLVALNYIANPAVHRNLSARGESDAQFYIVFVLIASVGMALFFAQGERLKLALQAGLAAGVVVAVLAAPSDRLFAIPAFLVMFGGVLFLTGLDGNKSAAAAPMIFPRGATAARSLPIAQSASYVVAMMLFVGGFARTAAMAERGGLLPFNPTLAAMWASKPASTLVIWAAAQFSAACALCFAPVRPFVLAALCCWMLSLAVLELVIGRPTIDVAFHLAEAGIFAWLCVALFRSRSDQPRAFTRAPEVWSPADATAPGGWRAWSPNTKTRWLRPILLAGAMAVLAVLVIRGFKSFEQQFDKSMHETPWAMAAASVMGNDPALHALMLREARHAYETGGWEAVRRKTVAMIEGEIMVYADDPHIVDCSKAMTALAESLTATPYECRIFIDAGSSPLIEQRMGEPRAVCDTALANGGARRKAGATLEVSSADDYAATFQQLLEAPSQREANARAARSTPRDDAAYCDVHLTWMRNLHALPQKTVAGFLRATMQSSDGPRDGQGVRTSVEDATRYQGEFRDGKMNGQGVMFFPDRKRYEGEFRDDHRTGHGVSTLLDGTRYEGEFTDGWLNGHGIATMADGSRYEGGFSHGKRNGHGIETTPDGQRHEGEFRDDQPAPP